MFHEVLVWHSPGLRRLDGVWKDDFLRNGIHGQRMSTVRCVHPLSLVMTQRFSQALFSVIGLLFTCTFWKLFSPITVLEPRHSTISRRQDARCLDVCFHQGPPPHFLHHITTSNLVFCFSVRSVVYQQNSKESATLQPFFTLQLDIQSEKIRTVQEALETLVARESVQGYTSKTKQEVWIKYTFSLFSHQRLTHYTILKPPESPTYNLKPRS